MKIETGDLFDYDFDLILHGANCFNTMNAGIAYQIRRRYPIAYKADADYMRGYPEYMKLGDFSWAITPAGVYVVNLYTQYRPGPQFDICAYKISLWKALQHFGEFELKIGMPQIGCGIGGSTWDEVSKVTEPLVKNHNVTVVVFNK